MKKIIEVFVENWAICFASILFLPLGLILLFTKKDIDKYERKILGSGIALFFLTFTFIYIIMLLTLNTHTVIDKNGNEVVYFTTKTDEELEEEKRKEIIKKEEDKKNEELSKMKQEKEKHEKDKEKNKNSPIVTIYDLDKNNSEYKNKYVKFATKIDEIGEGFVKSKEDIEIGKDIKLELSNKEDIQIGDFVIVVGKLKGNKFGLSGTITLESAVVLEKGENASKLYLESKSKVINQDIEKFKKEDKERLEELNNYYNTQNENIINILEVLKNNPSYQNQLESIYLFSKVSDNFSKLSDSFSMYYLDDSYSHSFSEIIKSYKYNMSQASKHFVELSTLMSTVNYSMHEFDDIHQKALYHQTLGRDALNGLNLMVDNYDKSKN